MGVTFRVSMRTELKAPTARTAATSEMKDFRMEPADMSGRVKDRMTTVRLMTDPMEMSKSPDIRLYCCARATKASGSVRISQLLRLNVFQKTGVRLPM